MYPPANDAIKPHMWVECEELRGPMWVSSVSPDGQVAYLMRSRRSTRSVGQFTHLCVPAEAPKRKPKLP